MKRESAKKEERDREFELLASAFRLRIKYERQYARDARRRQYAEMFAEAAEAAMARRALTVLRANYGELKGQVEDAEWGPDFLEEFKSLHGISFFEIRGKKGPDARLARILERGTIETPADFRCAQERLDGISGKASHAEEESRLVEMIDVFDEKHRK
jgi:hypothetical protein